MPFEVFYETPIFSENGVAHSLHNSTGICGFYSDVANLSHICLKAGKLKIFPSCWLWKLAPNLFVDFRDNDLSTVDWAMVFL